MKRNALLAAFVLCLAVFGPFPILAEQPIHEKVTSDPLQSLLDAGWVQVSPGVLTRDRDFGKVEVLGLGAEGLQYRLQDLRKQLRHLKARYDEYPTEELRDSLRAYRSEVRRVMEQLETAKSASEVAATAKAGIACTINYGANADAFPLGPATQGVGAIAEAYFNSNCSHVGEVWAHAYGEGRKADNSFWTVTKTDPLAGGSAPYIGSNVRASASISLNVIKECYSYAYASVTSYDINLVYSVNDSNYSCPPPTTPFSISSVTSNYGSSIHLYGSDDCATVTWTATGTGGTTPYSFTWYNGTTYLGAGSTHSRTFCGLNLNTTRTFTATANGSDSSSPVQTASGSHTLTIYHHYVSDPGGCYLTADGKALPVCP